MPLVPSSAPLPSSMSTFAYLREQKILNIVYIALLSIEALMVVGVCIMALVKRAKLHRRLKARASPYLPVDDMSSLDIKRAVL